MRYDVASLHTIIHPKTRPPQELHRDLLFGCGFRVLRGLPVPPAVTFECAVSLLWCRNVGIPSLLDQP